MSRAAVAPTRPTTFEPLPARDGGSQDSRRAAVVLGLGILLALILVSPQLLNDPDSQWHPAIGRWIWSHRALPTVDTFSHTYAGRPWIAKEWLSQLMFFAAQAAAGWRGVVLLAASAIATAFGMLFAFLAPRLRVTAALAAVLLVFMLATPHLLARPHVLVFPIVVLWVSQLVRALERRVAPPLPLALGMAAWANMHGSFPLGLVMAGVLAGEGVLLRAAGSRRAASKGWGLFLAAAGAASLVSPYGLDAVLVPLHMGGNAALPFVSEWQPLTFDMNGLLALGLAAASLVVLAVAPVANAFRIVMVVLLAALMIRHARFADIFGLAAPILVAGTLARRWRLAPTPYLASKGLRVAAAVSMLVLVPAVIAALVVVDPRPNPAMTPEAAFRAAQAQGVSGPVYNDYDFGGFLIAHGVRTFVDGRSDQLFLDDFLPSLQRALDAPDDRAFAAVLTRYGVRWALVRSRSPDARHLAALPGWSKLAEDDVAALFVARPADRLSAR